MGNATSSQFDSQGVCDQSGLYGSTYSITSIHDQFGPYGSLYSVTSAYDMLTSTPPFLYCVTSGAVLNYVTKNTFLPNRIDPDNLCAVLAGAGY